MYEGPINVGWFGADPTSSSDAGSKINAAIAALPAGGGEIYIPEGLYLITTQIVLSKYIKVTGAGPNATVLQGSGISIIKVTSIWGSSISNLSIRNQNTLSSNTTVGIELNGIGNDGISRFDLNNCWLIGHNNLGTGIKLVFALQNSFSLVHIIGWQTGILTEKKVISSQDAKSNANNWIACEVQGNIIGADLHDLDDQYFHACVIEANDIGAYLTSAGTNFTSCHFENGRGTQSAPSPVNIVLEQSSALYTFGCVFAFNQSSATFADIHIDVVATTGTSRIMSTGDLFNSGITNKSTAQSTVIAPRGGSLPVASNGTNNLTVLQSDRISGNSAPYNYKLQGFNALEINNQIIAPVNLYNDTTDGDKGVWFRKNGYDRGVIGLEKTFTGAASDNFGLWAFKNLCLWAGGTTGVAAKKIDIGDIVEILSNLKVPAHVVHSKPGAVSTNDVPSGTYQVWDDGSTVKLYANIGGVLKSVQLT